MKTAKSELKRQAGAANKMVVVLLSAIILLLVLAMGGAAWAFTSGKLDGLLSGETEPEPVQVSEKPLFKPLNKFVVSLANDRVQHYMMLELTLVSHHPDMPAQADSMESVIRNALLKHFSSQSQQSVREEMQDIEALQEVLRGTLVAAAEGYGQELPVEKVLITNVVIQ